MNGSGPPIDWSFVLSAGLDVSTRSVGLAFAPAGLTWRRGSLGLVRPGTPLLSDTRLRNNIRRAGHSCGDADLGLYLQNMGRTGVLANHMLVLRNKGFMRIGTGLLLGLYGAGLN